MCCIVEEWFTDSLVPDTSAGNRTSFLLTSQLPGSASENTLGGVSLLGDEKVQKI